MNSIIAKIGVMAALLLVLGNSQSCSTRPNLVIHQSDTLSVVLRELPAGYPPLMPHNHPYTISPKYISEILASLDYSEGSLLPFSQGQAHRVFSRHQAELLAPDLSKALSLALPQEVAVFTLADEEKPDRRTKGLGFVLGDELHLIIEDLRKPFYQGEQKPYQQQLFRWELLPGSRQRHYTSRPGGKGAITNWIITPLR
jgi:hypothetical protein